MSHHLHFLAAPASRAPCNHSQPADDDPVKQLESRPRILDGSPGHLWLASLWLAPLWLAPLWRPFHSTAIKKQASKVTTTCICAPRGTTGDFQKGGDGH